MAASTSLRKVKATTAAEICGRFELAPESKPLLEPKASPREFLDALVSSRHFPTAIRFLAHALPPREAVWWGSLCVKHVSDGALPAPETEALKAAVVWVLEPTEKSRQAAEVPSRASGRQSSAGLLATAVTWTGGTLAPPLPRVPPVLPGPWLPARGVLGAVLLAATRGKAGVEETQRLFVEVGVGVAEGRVTWPDVKPKTVGKTWGY